MLHVSMSENHSQSKSYGFFLNDHFGLNHLSYQSFSLPALKSDEAQVRLTHSALNYRDLLMVEGKYNPGQALPLIPCSDGVGIVEAVGEHCDLSVGQRVIPLFSQGWGSGQPSRVITETTLGGPLDGTLRTHANFKEAGLVPVPEYLTDEEASTLGCAALTAWSALVELNQVSAGQHVLCIGTGGVSLFAAQIAALHGARVTLTSRDTEKLNRVLSSTGFYPYTDHIQPFLIEDSRGWGRALKKKHGEVDHVIEVGGAGTLDESISAVRAGGTISLIGVLAGGSAPVNLTPVLMRQIKIQGVIVGHREGMLNMLKAFEHNRLKPIISSLFTLQDAVSAFRALKAAQHVGKIVLIHDEEKR